MTCSQPQQERVQQVPRMNGRRAQEQCTNGQRPAGAPIHRLRAKPDDERGGEPCCQEHWSHCGDGVVTSDCDANGTGNEVQAGIEFEGVGEQTSALKRTANASHHKGRAQCQEACSTDEQCAPPIKRLEAPEPSWQNKNREDFCGDGQREGHSRRGSAPRNGREDEGEGGDSENVRVTADNSLLDHEGMERPGREENERDAGAGELDRKSVV